MSKITLALKSRTFWTVAVMVVLNVLPHLPFNGETRDLITGVLGLLAAYFHVNPSQNYNQA
jgi:hypothetical protein